MKNIEFRFERLIAWQKSRIYSKDIYFATSRLPKEETYGLIIQMRRSATSVCSNLAEGSGRISSKDEAHYTTMAYGSLMENINQVILAGDLGYITEEQITSLKEKANELARILSGLRDSQLRG